MGDILATALEEALTVYFGHPAVQGILLWGFWDGKIFEANASLVEGPDLTVCMILPIENRNIGRYERPPDTQLKIVLVKSVVLQDIQKA